MPKKKETRGRKPIELTPKKKQQYIYDRDNNWKKQNTRCINVRYNIENDKQILDKLDSVDNKANYIRQLILDDIKKEEK